MHLVQETREVEKEIHLWFSLLYPCVFLEEDHGGPAWGLNTAYLDLVWNLVFGTHSLNKVAHTHFKQTLSFLVNMVYLYLEHSGISDLQMLLQNLQSWKDYLIWNLSEWTK